MDMSYLLSCTRVHKVQVFTTTGRLKTSLCWGQHRCLTSSVKNPLFTEETLNNIMLMLSFCQYVTEFI